MHHTNILNCKACYKHESAVCVDECLGRLLIQRCILAEDPDTPDMRSDRPEEDRKATGRKAAETRAEKYGDTTV